MKNKIQAGQVWFNKSRLKFYLIDWVIIKRNELWVQGHNERFPLMFDKGCFLYDHSFVGEILSEIYNKGK